MTLVYLDDRTTFTIEHDQRYAFGDPENPVLVLNAVDADGCVWVADAPEGWALPEVSLPMDRRQDGHGGYAGEATYEPRALSWEGTVTAPSPAALDLALARLTRALLGEVPNPVRYSHLDDRPAPRGLWLFPTGAPKWRAFDDRAADWAFVMVAEDPIRTGFAEEYGPVRLPSAAGEGGYTMGAGGLVQPVTSTGGATTVGLTVAHVANDGDEPAHAVYTVTGPVPRPRVVLGDGQYVALDADLGALDVWVIDTTAGTSTVNGVNRYDAWGAGSVFPLIPGGDPVLGVPGGTEVRLRSATGGADPAAGLSILTASSWK